MIIRRPSSTPLLKARRTVPAAVGEFERYTLGFGRRLLESQGWQEGRGLGKTGSGRAHIVDAGGRNPRDKQGLG